MAESTQQQTFQCTSGPVSFTTGTGIARHQVAHNRQEEPVSTPTETASSIRSEDPTAANDSVIRANLPPFVPVNPIPTQAYNNIPDTDLANPVWSYLKISHVLQDAVDLKFAALGSRSLIFLQ